MTKESIIKSVIQRIDEISPSAVSADLNLGNTIDEIMQSVANEYALAYPVASSQVFTAQYSDFSKTGISLSGSSIVGERITPSASMSQWLRFFEYKDDISVIRNTFSINGKKRLAVERGLIMPTSKTVLIFEYYNRNPYLEIFPKPLIIMPTIKYVAAFDPTAIPDKEDRGFFDNFIWYLGYRTLQTCGGPEKITVMAKEVVDSHFKTISQIPY